MVLFNADIQQNFTWKEVRNKQKKLRQKVKNMKQKFMLILD